MKSQYDVFPKKLTLFAILILTSAYILLMVRVSHVKELVTSFYRTDIPGLQLYCGASRLVSLNQLLNQTSSQDTVTMKLNQQGIQYSLEEIMKLELVGADTDSLQRKASVKKFMATSQGSVVPSIDLEQLKADMEDFIERYLSRKSEAIENESNLTNLIARIGVAGILFFLGTFIYVYRMYMRNIRQLTVLTENLEQERANSMQAAKLASLGEMAGGIAHEINNPLAIISTTSHFLRKASSRGKLTPEILESNLLDIDATIQRISKIINGLRNVARDSDSDPMEGAFIQDIINDALSVCSERLKDRGIVVRVDDQENLQGKEVLCRRVQISQVLINLIGNSYDAIVNSEGEKLITLRLERQGHKVSFHMYDSGAPIPAKIREKLFQPFFTTKEIGKGTGLGLSISKSIIEAHEGRFYLDPRTDINEFIFDLPLTEKT